MINVRTALIVVVGIVIFAIFTLLVIAPIIGTLIFVASTPTASVNCASSNPVVLNVVSRNLLASASRGSELGELVVTNTSGGALSNVTINGSRAFADNSTTSLPVGNTTLDVTASSVPGTHAWGAYTIDYTDSAGLIHTDLSGVTITCRGTDFTIS